MFVPVSPSGTGYTLSRLMPSWWASRASRYPSTTARRSSAPRRVNDVIAGILGAPLGGRSDPRGLAAVRTTPVPSPGPEHRS